MLPPEVLTFEQAVLNDIHNMVTPTSFNNLSFNEREAVRALTEDESIIIKQADKEGATVIMSALDYDTECQRQLNDKQYYTPLREDPTP